MKTIFTLILLTSFLGIFAQPKAGIGTKSASISISENQPYSISRVYPNPVKDIVNIEVVTTSSENIRVSLFNIMGVEVKVWEPFYIPEGGRLLNLNLSEFKSGVYIIKITNGNRVISQVIRKS